MIDRVQRTLTDDDIATIARTYRARRGDKKNGAATLTGELAALTAKGTDLDRAIAARSDRDA